MPKEKYEKIMNESVIFPSNLNRRQFLKRMGILGGGILVYFNAGSAILSAQMAGRFRRGAIDDINALLRIAVDGKITCFTGKIEMGQGPITSLPQMLAEELDVNCDVVDIVMGDTDRCPWDMGTFGSMTTRIFGASLRKAAAEAKGILKELAVEHLKCEVDQMGTENGEVFDTRKPTNRISYGRLTKGNIIEKRLKEKPALTPPSAFKVMGKSVPRRDVEDKVTGRAEYAGDIRLPGMLYASILRPPAHGAKLKKLDTTESEKIEGIRIFREGDFIAALHALPDIAEKGAGLMKTEFDMPDTGINDQTIFDHIVKTASSPRIVSKDGDIETGKKQAAHIFNETYLDNYYAHAPMEPHTATAKVEGGKVTVWAATQAPFPAKAQIAQRLNIPEDNVRVITPYVGGGFGGKNANGQAVEAAYLAMKTGRPVQVAWSREEEFFLDTFRPASVVKITSGMDDEGKIIFWDYHVYAAGNRGSEVYYDIPHYKVSMYGGWMSGGESPHPFAVGAWRAPGNSTNTFAREVHMDLMAKIAGMDPLTFRLKNIKDERMIRVLQAVAKAFGPRASDTIPGRGMGVACGIDAGSYVAHMAEVDVDLKSGNIRVNRVVCAQDMGIVVNPEGAIIQMEGCITMGLGYALTEEIRFENGKIFNDNFGNYIIPRFSTTPKIETILVKNDELAPQGGGEPAIICMGAVIASAVLDGTGARLFQLPMTPGRFKAALQQVG